MGAPRLRVFLLFVVGLSMISPEAFLVPPSDRICGRLHAWVPACLRFLLFLSSPLLLLTAFLVFVIFLTQFSRKCLYAAHISSPYGFAHQIIIKSKPCLFPPWSESKAFHLPNSCGIGTLNPVTAISLTKTSRHYLPAKCCVCCGTSRSPCSDVGTLVPIQPQRANGLLKVWRNVLTHVTTISSLTCPRLGKAILHSRKCPACRFSLKVCAYFERLENVFLFLRNASR